MQTLGMFEKAENLELNWEFYKEFNKGEASE